ncbi:MAG: hypothetical protein ACRC4Y_01450 [Cetobacterium sp.]
MNFRKIVEEVLGFEVVEIAREEVSDDLKILEELTKYNKDETVSIEILNDETTYYVTRMDEDHEGEFIGYYRAK